MDLDLWNTFFIICFGIMAVIIIVGNILAISVLLKRRFRKRPHFLLISLAIADLLVGLCAVPIYMSLFTVSKRLMVVIYHCVDMFTGLSSIFTLAVISLERLNAIARPLRHRQLAISSYTIAIATPWILAVIVTSTRVLLGFSIMTIKQFSIVIIISLSTPLLTSCICYYIIWKKQVCRMNNEVLSRREAKLSRTLLLITVLFVLTWLPFQVLNVVLSICVSCERVPGVVVYVIKLLQYSNSFINFFIYCLRMSAYRNAVLLMFPSCKCNQKRRRVPYPLNDKAKGIMLISFKRTVYFTPVPLSAVHDI